MIERYLDLEPSIDERAFVHSDAVVIGDVVLGPQVSVWPGCVLRGDQGRITIGQQTSIQDGTIAHATGGLSTTTVGERVTVGHRVILHGCTVGSDCLIGMGAILMDNCEIEDWAIVGAGALVPAGKKIPGGKLAVGVPAKVVRDITDEEREWIVHSRETYLRLAREHTEGRR